jgi:hypothetical protein
MYCGGNRLIRHLANEAFSLRLFAYGDCNMKSEITDLA